MAASIRRTRLTRWTRLGSRIFGNRRARGGILLLWAAAVLAAGAVLAVRFRIDNSVSVWFAQDDPALAEYRSVLADFGAREWALVGLGWAVEDEAARAADRARYVARAEGLPEVHAVVSASRLPADAPLVREFLRPDPESSLEGLLVQVTNDLDRQDGYRERLTDELRDAGADLPAVRAVRVAGIVAINGELNRSARRDMAVFFPAVAALLALLGGLLFRNARDTGVLLAVALATVVTTMGLLVARGHPLNMVTIMLPTVLIALSVADVVHLIHVFHRVRDGGTGAARAAGLAVRRVAGPCLGTTVTTAAGFLAFGGSSVLPIRQLAFFGAGGVALAWVLTMTLAPALLVGLWDGRDRAPIAGGVGEKLVSRLWHHVGRHPVRTAATFALSGAALLGLGRLQADTDYVRFFRSGSRVPEDYRALERAGIPQNPLTLVLELPSTHAGMARAAPALLEFTRELERLDGVRAVLSPLTLSGPAGTEARALLGLGMLSEREDRIQITAMMDYPSSRRLRTTLRGVRRLERELLWPELSVTATGTSLLWANMDEGVIRTQRQSLLIVTVVCFVILVLLFRSIELGLIGLLLSAYPVAVILGVMGLAGVTLNMATVLIAGIAVGIAVDDTIHFVHAWQAERNRGADRWSACARAMKEVGVRMVTTSAILIGAFAIMGVSSFIPTAQFGLLSSATIAVALAADMTLLPVVLARGRRAAAGAPERATDARRAATDAPGAATDARRAPAAPVGHDVAPAEAPGVDPYARGCRPKLAELLSCVGLDATYTRARGAYLYRADEEGRERAVLDLVGGFGAGLLGHNPPELRALLKAQLDAEMPFLAQSAVRREAGLLAEAINAMLPTRRRYLCHLSNSGAEAVEAALKHAYKVRFDANRRAFERVSRDIEEFHRTAERDHPDLEVPGAKDLAGFRDDIDEHNIAELERFQRNPVVLAFKGAFHGKTATALKVTFNRTYREGFEGLSAVRPVFIDFEDVARLDAIVERHRVELLLPRVEDGRVVVQPVHLTTVIGLCLEVIQGEGGVRPVPDEVLATLATRHQRVDVPLVVDEIQTGCGRTGAFLAFGDTPLAAVDPEYITLGKGLGGGLTKVAATLIRDDVYDPDFGILHTSTFAEDELGSGVARRVLEILARDDGRVMRDVREKGEYLAAGLRRLQARFPDVIHDVRGRGLMLGVEFTELRGHSPLFRFGSRQGFLSLLVASYLLHRHDIRVLAPLTTLFKGNPGKKRLSVLRIQPAVEITRAEMDRVLEALAEVCTLIERNNEAALMGHLVGLGLTPDELRDPRRIPATNVMPTPSPEFDARVGFIMHPIHIGQVLRYYFPSLRGRVDPGTLARWWSRLGRFLEPDVVHVDRVEAGGFIVQVNLVSVPYLPRDMARAWQAGAAPDADRAARLRLQEMQDKIQDAVTVARELGDDHIPTCVVGLGAFTSILTDRGTAVNDFEVPVTTGNAYTAGLMVQGIHRAAELKGLDLTRAGAAVVGASGNIGSTLAAMLAADVGTLRLVGSPRPGSRDRLLAARRRCLEHLARRIAVGTRPGGLPNEERLGWLARRLLRACPRRAWSDPAALTVALEAALGDLDPEDNPYITVHQSPEAVRDCDIVTVATSSPAARLISPATVRRGAIVSCASVPSNLSDAFQDHMHEYFVFDGGFARLPGAQSIDCIGMPGGGLAFGCLSETLLLGFDGCHRSFARGVLTPAQVDEVLAMADRYGFDLGEFKLDEAVHPITPDSAAA